MIVTSGLARASTAPARVARSWTWCWGGRSSRSCAAGVGTAHASAHDAAVRLPECAR
ncbi:hypothetical protein QJS66_13735 [Kocuria rhizophila]|nr:hypothetical protein QJS66_13735 [Kocuria rhizophila]